MCDDDDNEFEQYDTPATRMSLVEDRSHRNAMT